MATLTEIREALAVNLDVLTDVQVSAYMLASPTPPSAHLYPGGGAGEIEYDLAMRPRPRQVDVHRPGVRGRRVRRRRTGEARRVPSAVRVMATLTT
jgi:hypothetical protein